MLLKNNHKPCQSMGQQINVSQNRQTLISCQLLSLHLLPEAGLRKHCLFVIWQPYLYREVRNSGLEPETLGLTLISRLGLRMLQPQSLKVEYPCVSWYNIMATLRGCVSPMSSLVGALGTSHSVSQPQPPTETGG